jgi:CDP-glucose 4,6-dehydratase
VANLGVDVFWRDRPTLVTGASGLLGGWLLKRLLDRHADVVCLVRDWIPQSQLAGAGLVDRIKLVRGDVRAQGLLERVLSEYEIHSVFHLAAQTGVGIANRNPVSTFASNIQGTWSLLEACRRSPLVKQVVIASSDKAYGARAELPYSEEMPLQGRYPYDVSKSCADLVAQSYAATFGLPVGITRCGNLYGGGDLNWRRLVPGTIRSVLRGCRPVIRSDGQYIRDYLYVEDAAEAYLQLAESIATDPDLAGRAFNFSDERPLSVLALVQRILSLMDSKLEPEIRQQAEHEIRAQYLSAAQARTRLGWRPRFTLDEGLSVTIEWYRELLAHE